MCRSLPASKRLAWPIFLAFSLLSTTVGAQSTMPTSGYDRPSGDRKQSRSVVMAKHGIVATSHPLAAQAGLDILKQGGNAVDAAIAANAMLGVVEPMSCGIGGDLFAIIWDAKSQKLLGLNASGRSPRELSRTVILEQGLEAIPTHGPLSWSVPGCVDGWDQLLRKFGTRSLGDCLAPAIATAEEGFPVAEIIATQWRSSAEALGKYPTSAEAFLVAGKRAPQAGEIFHNHQLAKTLRRIAAGGSAAFYREEIAAEIVAFSREAGGHFTLRDFEQHTSTWVEPVSTSYRGYDVWELPPNGQGIAVLQMLNLLEPHDVAAMGPGSADYLHLFLEAKKLAYADRARFYADPDFAALPVRELISKPYAAVRGKRIDLARAATDIPAGDPKLAHGDTVYITVVDKDRNCCSLIQSIYHGFGSHVVPGKLGFTLQNRGSSFALDPEHPNSLEPGKRPFHTIIPGMLTQQGRPVFCFGVMGGDMQPQGHVQILVNLLDFGMNVQSAGDAARVRHSGSAEPNGQPGDGGGTVFVESGVTDEVVADLRQRGHKVMRARDGYGGYQGIWIDWERGVLHGGSEVRKDGAAVGY
jgi:gamma-glutamyltranspeptidase / glutathione hydrolase